MIRYFRSENENKRLAQGGVNKKVIDSAVTSFIIRGNCAAWRVERSENAKNSQIWPWRCSTDGKMSQDQRL